MPRHPSPDNENMPDRVTEYGDPRDLGPCMRKLTDLQRRFVMAMVITGGMNRKRCAEMAGYSMAGTGSAVGIGHKLANDPKILAAVAEVARGQMGMAQMAAVRAITEIVDDVTHKDRFKAAATVLDRTGIPVVSEKTLRIEKTESKLEKIEKIIAMAKALGLDPRAMLGSATDVTEDELNGLLIGAPIVIEGNIVEGNEFAGLEDLI